MAEKQLRWGILGAARVNEKLLPAIVEAANAKLVAIASRRTGAAAKVLQKLAPEQTEVQTLDDPEALLSHSQIDAIYLPMSNEEHAEWALKAINHGKHVLIEKPMALTVADIDAIEAAAKANNVTVMEGCMYIFHPQHAYVKQLIDDGKRYGEIDKTLPTTWLLHLVDGLFYTGWYQQEQEEFTAKQASELAFESFRRVASPAN